MSAQDLEKGDHQRLVVGDRDTVVQRVRVVCGDDETTLSPEVGLPVGKRYSIVVGADGKVEASVLDR